jgi:phosphatidylserine decarboxylase
MIKYYDRKSKGYEIEKVAGEKYLEWSVSSKAGKSLLELFIKKKIFSCIYGKMCDTRFSRGKINDFIDNYKIDMDLCEKDQKEFKSFNDFFTRKLKSSARPISSNPSAVISPGDGRMLAYEDIDLENLIQVKGYSYKLGQLIDDKRIAEEFSHGTCIVLRLCPTDYHRFHFIDSGICENTARIPGDYYSVNPVSLKEIPELFCRNKREWSIFHCDNFGDVLYVEVGAACVGTIIQTYEPEKHVLKGSEKGYFKFGGSTVILFFQNGKIKVDSDIIEQTKLGFETKILMGEHIGDKL